MKPKRDRRPSEPRKRFRIEKLEERVAPARGGKGTRNCSGTPSGATGSGGETGNCVSIF